MVMLVSAGVFLAGMIYGVYKMMEEGDDDAYYSPPEKKSVD